MSGYISSQYDSARDYIKKQDEQIRILKEALVEIRDSDCSPNVFNIAENALEEVEEMSNED